MQRASAGYNVPWVAADWLLSAASWAFYAAVGLYAVSLVLSETDTPDETSLGHQFGLLWACIPVTALGMFLLLFHSLALPKGLLFTHHLRIIAMMASHAGQTLIVGARLAKVKDLREGDQEDHLTSSWLYTGAGVLYGLALMLALGSAVYSALKETAK